MSACPLALTLFNPIVYAFSLLLLLLLLPPPFYSSLDFVRDNPGEPVPEETFTHTYHGRQSSLICFLRLLRSMASLFNLRAWQSFHTLSLSFLWSTSWPGTLHFILHTFLHPIIVFFSQPMSIPSQPIFCCRTELMSSNPSLSLNPLLWNLSCSLIPHIYLTILISACWSATSFSFLMGQVF